MAQFPTNTQLVNSVNTVLAQKTYVGDQADAISQLFGASTLSAAVISSGNIAPTSGMVLVDTEASASADDLDTIDASNLHSGAVIAIQATNASRIVTVKHQAGGTGQIYLMDTEDRDLDNMHWLMLRLSGSDWVEFIPDVSEPIKEYLDARGLWDDAYAVNLSSAFDYDTGTVAKSALISANAGNTNGPPDADTKAYWLEHTDYGAGSSMQVAHAVLRTDSTFYVRKRSSSVWSDWEPFTPSVTVPEFHETTASTGAWVLTGLTAGKPLYLHAEQTTNAGARIEFTINDGLLNNAGEQAGTTYENYIGSASTYSNSTPGSAVVIPATTTLTINVSVLNADYLHATQLGE